MTLFPLQCVRTEESFLFIPCPLSSVTKMMTESVARNFQLLFDYVCDDDARLALNLVFISELSKVARLSEC